MYADTRSEFRPCGQTPQGEVTGQVAELLEGLPVTRTSCLIRLLVHPQTKFIGTPQVTTQVTTQVGNLLRAAVAPPKSREELQSAAGLANREHFRKAYVGPLVAP